MAQIQLHSIGAPRFSSIVDPSVWIDYFKGTITAQTEKLDNLLGVTVRRTIDTVIATRCIESGFGLLHNDRDFDVFSQRLGLRVVA